MMQEMLDDWAKLSPQTKAMIVGLVLGFAERTWKAFRSSSKATFFEKAHEAAVTGIEDSNCEDCRKAAKAAAVDLGIEDKLKPIVVALKAELADEPKQLPKA